MEWPACTDEYEKLIIRMSTPRVVIDNAVCSAATIVKVTPQENPPTLSGFLIREGFWMVGESPEVSKRAAEYGDWTLVPSPECTGGGWYLQNHSDAQFDSVRKQGILLEAVQVLSDLDLSIKKAYVSSDGRWFMNVFHVTDLEGNKLTDESVLRYIEQSLGSVNNGKTNHKNGLTALELTGADRVGLLSEVFAVLAELQCDVVDAKIWTHNGRIASLIYVKDCNTGTAIDDSQKISRLEARLRNVLQGDNEIWSAKTSISNAVIHPERRLHQMMFTDRDYQKNPIFKFTSDTPLVTVQNWAERGYSVVNVQCKDRVRLLFDVVCNLTDMEYVVFHATINSTNDQAYLEFYIRHKDGTPISSEPEGQRVIQCLQAAVSRRASKGVRLELCTKDKQGLLAEVMRTFRENGLNVMRAEITTIGDLATNVFYVTDAIGYPADQKLIESVRQKIGLSNLIVKELPFTCPEKAEREDQSVGVGGAVLLSLGSLVRRNLYNLGLIKSCS